MRSTRGRAGIFTLADLGRVLQSAKAVTLSKKAGRNVHLKENRHGSTEFAVYLSLGISGAYTLLRIYAGGDRRLAWRLRPVWKNDDRTCEKAPG
jgi:hypothetical protein